MRRCVWQRGEDTNTELPVTRASTRHDELAAVRLMLRDCLVVTTLCLACTSVAGLGLPTLTFRTATGVREKRQ